VYRAGGEAASTIHEIFFSGGGAAAPALRSQSAKTNYERRKSTATQDPTSAVLTRAQGARGSAYLAPLL